MQMSGSARGRSFDLGQERISIGRSDENGIVLPHESVSREHAFVEPTADGHYAIYDNESKNGIIVNGVKVESALLQNGDVVVTSGNQFLRPGQIVEPVDEAGATKDGAKK